MTPENAARSGPRRCPDVPAPSGGRKVYALAAAVAGFAFLLALFPLQCHDIWWHLANGREIASGRGIPQTNLYSFTHPDYPVTPTHWLFGLGSFLVHRVAGESGLVVAKALLVGTAFLLAYVLARRRGASDAAACLVVALAAVVARARFLERPHLFTMAGLAAFALLVDAIRGGRRRLVWVLPALTALWANLHAGCLFGVGLLGLEAAGEAVSWFRARRTRGKDSDEALAARRLAALLGLAAAGSALAAMASPAGWGVYAYNLWHLGLGKTVELVEFAAPLPWERPAFYVLLVGGAAALLYDRLRAACVRLRRCPTNGRAARDEVAPGETLVFGAFGLLALYAVRGIPNFALLAAPIVAPCLTREWDVLRRSRRLRKVARAVERVPGWALGTALVFFPFSGHLLGGPFREFRVGVGVRRDFFPESSAAFVLEHLPRARVFNDLAAGGYLAWRWHPDRGVFIDGRTNAYPPELFKTMYGYEERARAGMSGLVPEHDSALDVDPEERGRAWRKLVNAELSTTMGRLTGRYSLDAALLYFYRDANPFWPVFDPYEWVVVHAEKSAMVLVRRRAGHGDLIARFEGGLGARGEAVFSKRLEAVGEVVRAAGAANSALLDEFASGGGVFRPSERAGLFMRRGNGHRVSQRYERAAEDYRAALRIEPDSVEARLNLGFCLLALKRVEEARAEFARVRDHGRRRGYACYGLAECAKSLGREDEAARLYEEFLKRSGRSRSVDREKATKALEAIRARQAR